MRSPPRLRRLRALILHRTPVREKDRFVEAFSREEGRIRLLAAGVRRFPSRRAGHLEPLLESEILVSASARGDSIRDARVLHAFPRLRADGQRLRVAYAIACLLHMYTGLRLADASLYDAVRALFLALDDPAREPSLLLLGSAELQILRHLGSLPSLEFCGRCRRKLRAGSFFFVAAARGFLCRGCTARAGASENLDDTVKVLRLLARAPVPPRNLVVPESVVRRVLEILLSLARALGEGGSFSRVESMLEEWRSTSRSSTPARG